MTVSDILTINQYTEHVSRVTGNPRIKIGTFYGYKSENQFYGVHLDLLN